MEELIFFAIIIFFSIIDSIARRRRKRQKDLPGGAPSPAEWEWEDDELETYDAEPSYDDREPRSSEEMIPSDIWEEIAGLAGGKKRQHEPSSPPPIEVDPIPPRPVSTHRVHRSHAGYGTDPSSRRRSEQDEIDPLRRRLSRDARAVRRQLQSHKKHALRRAVILHEILGPPTATRPDRIDEPFSG